MNVKGKEINNVVFSSSLNVDYLAENDLYIYKKESARYKFNVIGSGMMAQEHMRVTMLEGRAVIHGIYDINDNSVNKAREMFERLFPNNPLVTYDSLEDACNDSEVNGLIICTPNYTHLNILRTAINSGKHILMEKPMVTTLRDALEMKIMTEGYNAVFQVGLQYRYKAIYASAREEVLKRGVLGEIHTISIMEHRLPFLDKVEQWNKFSEYSGGTLVEKCCHYFDLFNLFAGAKPLYVYAVGGQAVNFKDFKYNGKESDILDHAIVTVVYENGIKCNFNLCMFAPMFYEEIVICGTKGRLKAYENQDYLRDAKPQTYLEILTAEHSPSKISIPGYPKTIQTSGHMGGTYYEHKNFVDNMEGKITDTATVEDGFWSVIIGLAAEESVKTGEKVFIKDML